MATISAVDNRYYVAPIELILAGSPLLCLWHSKEEKRVNSDHVVPEATSDELAG